MAGSLFQLFSPRGALARGGYAVVLAGLAAVGYALAQWGVGVGAAGYFCGAVAFSMVWIFTVSVGKRLKDAERSRAWIFAPLALGLAAFPIGFSLHHPPDVIAGMDPYGKGLAVVTIFPVIAGAFVRVAMKIGAGLEAMALVWALFALLLLAPGSKRHV